MLIKKKWKISEVTIMCYREIAGENTDLSQCKLMDIEIPEEELTGKYILYIFNIY